MKKFLAFLLVFGLVLGICSSVGAVDPKMLMGPMPKITAPLYGATGVQQPIVFTWTVDMKYGPYDCYRVTLYNDALSGWEKVGSPVVMVNPKTLSYTMKAANLQTSRFMRVTVEHAQTTSFDSGLVTGYSIFRAAP